LQLHQYSLIKYNYNTPGIYHNVRQEQLESFILFEIYKVNILIFIGIFLHSILIFDFM